MGYDSYSYHILISLVSPSHSVRFSARAKSECFEMGGICAIGFNKISAEGKESY